MWVGIIESTESLNRTKGEIRPSLPGCFSWDTALLLPSALLVLRPSDPYWNLHLQLPWFPHLWIQVKLHHWLSWVTSLKMANSGTSQPQYCMRHFLILYIYKEPWLIHSLSLSWRPVIYTQFSLPRPTPKEGMTQQATQMVLHIVPREEQVTNEVPSFLIWRKLNQLFTS